MLNGLDDIGQTMDHKEEIEAWQAADKNAAALGLAVSERAVPAALARA